MTLREFIKRFIATNTMIRLWEDLSEYGHEPRMLFSGNGVRMEHEILKDPFINLSRKVKHVLNVLTHDGHTDAVNIVLEVIGKEYDYKGLVLKVTPTLGGDSLLFVGKAGITINSLKTLLKGRIVTFHLKVFWGPDSEKIKGEFLYKGKIDSEGRIGGNIDSIEEILSDRVGEYVHLNVSAC